MDRHEEEGGEGRGEGGISGSFLCRNNELSVHTASSHVATLTHSWMLKLADGSGVAPPPKGGGVCQRLSTVLSLGGDGLELLAVWKHRRSTHLLHAFPGFSEVCISCWLLTGISEALNCLQFGLKQSVYEAKPLIWTKDIPCCQLTGGNACW